MVLVFMIIVSLVLIGVGFSAVLFSLMLETNSARRQGKHTTSESMTAPVTLRVPSLPPSSRRPLAA